jgi:ABC-type phosphate/phosphonate transport system substrate-binding protein
MYDEPAWAAANDALWSAIGGELRAGGLAGVPARLTRDAALPAIWTDPRLLLAQTCGWPLVTGLAERVTLVATPCYALPGCDGPHHRAFLVVRDDDPATDLAALRGRRLAVNGLDSNSGMNLLRSVVAPLAEGGRFFAGVAVTGAHRASLAAVAAGTADVTAVDCVTFGLLARHVPAALAGLRVLARTPASPSLPFITRADTPAMELTLLRTALAAALGHPAARTLGLAGFEILPLAAYDPLLALAQAAARRGYPHLG